MRGIFPRYIYIIILYNGTTALYTYSEGGLIMTKTKQLNHADIKRRDTVRRVMNKSSDIRMKMESVNKYSLCGVSGLGFPGKISPVRSLMFSKHASQRVVLDHGEFPRIFTGAEDAYGKRSSFFVTAKNTLVLERKFVKFPNTPYSSVLYIFRDTVTNKYVCHLAEAVHWNVEKYGFQNIDMIKNNYDVSDTIPKDTVISKTTSYDENNHYCAGANLRILYTTLHDLTEDAIILSESACKKLEYSMVDKVTVDISEKMFMLNNYGTLENYKAFPDIGEEIQSGILCSLREISALSSKSEAMIPHINDVNYYTNGIITDIDIYSNCPDLQDKQLAYYHNGVMNWYTEIYSYVSTIINHVDQDDTKLLDIYHKAKKYLMTQAKWSTKEKLPYIQVVFKILQKKQISKGQKITGRYGNKSVVSLIFPDRCMPKDEFGRPVDMLANGFAPTNRIIGFALYEGTITFQMECIHNYILDPKNNLSRDEAVQLVIDYMSLFNHDWANSIKRKYQRNPQATYDDIRKNGLYMLMPPFQPENARDATIEAYDRWEEIAEDGVNAASAKWERSIFHKYTIKTKLRHRWIEQKRERHAIGYQYTWVLKQEASKNMTAVATGRTTLYDLPIKTSNYKNRKIPYSDNAIKFGEYDTYGFLQVVDVEMFGKMTTYYRGSQYEENSLLMSHLNDIGIPEGAVNQFPQLDCFKAYLKAIGIKLENDFTVNSINAVDKEETFEIGNHSVKISGSYLRTILVIYSYYIQYKNWLKTNNNGREEATVDMNTFVDNMLNRTDLFHFKNESYIREAFMHFFEKFRMLDEEKFLK